MNYYNIYLLTLCTIIISGCGGHHDQQPDINKSLPSIKIKTENDIVHCENNKLPVNKKVDTKTEIVTDQVDPEQIKQALNDYRELFKRDKVSLKEFNEKKKALEVALGVDEFLNSDE